jgi:hypothetical protein
MSLRPLSTHCGPSESPLTVTASEPLGGGMDIHKPRPWQGWREFGKELATIVLGVLIALGAEQTVETLRLERQAEALDAALVMGARTHLFNAEERIALAPCLDARMAHLRDKLLKSDRTWTADPEAFAARSDSLSPVMTEAFHTPSRTWATDIWQYALGSPALAHFTADRRRFFNAQFAQAVSARMHQEAEHTAEDQLSPLSYDLQLTPELKAHFLEELGGLAREEGAIRGSASQMLARAAKAGITSDPEEVKRAVAGQREFRGPCVRDVGI